MITFKKPKVAEFFLAAYLMSGFYKSAAPSPVDLTLLAGILTLLSALWRFKASGWAIPKGLGWFAAFATLALIPAFFTEWTPYASEKFVRFYTITCLAAVAAPLIVRGRSSVDRLVRSVLIIASVGVLYSALVLYDPSQRLTIVGTGTISLGRGFGLAGLFALLVVLVRKKWLLLSLAMACIFFTLAAGNRQGILALVLALGVCAVITKKRSRFLVGGVVGVALLFVLPLHEYIPQEALHRYEIIFQGDLSNVRFSLMEASVQNASLSGEGWGSFKEMGFRALRSEPIEYPHNIFLEALYELGPLVLTALLLAVFVAYLKAIRAARKGGFMELALLGALVFTTVTASLSGDLYSNKDFFAFLTIALTTPRPSPRPTGRRGYCSDMSAEPAHC